MSTIARLPQAKPLPAAPRTNSNCEIAAQAIVTGPQDTTVQATQPIVGTSQGQIAVRVGRLLIYVTDRQSLESFASAWREAETLAEQAFGPVLPPPAYRPRNSRVR
jgi:hypothetical protein